jgi:CheY-like chemotaxis protein
MQAFKRILVVDDSSRDVELVLDALSMNNVINQAIVVSDGAEALDYLYRRGKYEGRTSGQPAVVLLDLKMPKVDGLEVLRQVKGDPKLKSIPIVVMTSSREEQDLVRSYELGVNAYVVKPLNFPDFVEAVTRVDAFWAIVNEAPPGSEARPTDGNS